MSHKKNNLTLKEALDYLGYSEGLSSDDKDYVANSVHALYMQPPENEENLSGEDGEVECDIPDNFCPAQLKSGCEIVLGNGRHLENFDNVDDTLDENSDDELLQDSNPNVFIVIKTENELIISDVASSSKPLCIQPSKSNYPLPQSDKNSIFTWSDDDSIGTLPIFPTQNYEDCRHLKPHEQFEKFFDDKLLQHICDCSELYATLKGNKIPKITVSELRVFIAILFVSGYTGRTSYRSMWSVDDDLRNSMVFNSMRQNRFEEILRCLNFEPELQIKKNELDKLWKLRSLTDDIKAKMLQHFHPEQHLSFDESVIQYFGKHGCKQFIKRKPIRFGYKVWSLCTPTGYMVNFEIYQGKNPRSNSAYEQRFGKCAAALVNMIDDFSDEVRLLPYAFFFNNLFTSFPLLAYLKSRGYNGTGAIRENRIPRNCPIPHKKDFKKHSRGYYQSMKTNETDIHLTKWLDNSVVCIASSYLGPNPITTASRYSKDEKKKLNVPCPCVISEYNKNMCGVDRFDQNVSAYCVAFRDKKWWNPIFSWLLDACAQNAWQLHRTIHSSMSQLEFKRQIVIYYCKQHGQPPKSHRSTLSQKRRSDNESIDFTIRYDKTNHLVVPIEKKRRCAGDVCSSIVRTACSKCNIGLCLKCFKNYHLLD